MIVLVFLIVLICLWILYRYRLANKILQTWVEENNFTLLNKKQHFFYVITEVKYSPYRQFLYEIDIKNNESEPKKGLIIIGNWFWGLLREEIHVIWAD